MPNHYQRIKDLATQLGRPAKTLIALSKQNDPFYMLPSRLIMADWSVDICRRYSVAIGFHKRRIHYRIVSQKDPVLLPSGEPYENTLGCFTGLCEAARDAVYLELQPPNAFTDNRNPDPIIHEVEFREPKIYVDEGWLVSDLRMPRLPSLVLQEPRVPHKYQIEIWAEKSTVDDILEPLCRRYKLNAPRAVGEFSLTQCIDFVDRAEKHGRPVRILYISDFDPAGQDMPVSVARKIEFELDRRGISLDIKVKQIALTYEQCVELKLPRTPIKDTETRLERFEERFGEGATELDALEALQSGYLRDLLEQEIRRYWNPDHDDEIESLCEGINDQLTETTDETIGSYQGGLDELRADFETIAESYRAWCARAKPFWHAITHKLEQDAPCLNGIDWSSEFEADEDPDPLYDSSRDYVEQIDRYKKHQGKPIARQPRKERVDREVTCAVCGNNFITRTGATKCSQRCKKDERNAQLRAARAARTGAAGGSGEAA